MLNEWDKIAKGFHTKSMYYLPLSTIILSVLNHVTWVDGA